MTARFSTVEVLDLVTANDDFGVSDIKSSEEEGKGIHAYLGQCSFSSVDKSFNKK